MNYFVIGNPIEHSLSPKIHNEILGLSESFGKIKVENLSLFMANLGAYKGFNVTLPHKIEIMQYLSEIDQNALEIGAVNTVKPIINANGTRQHKGYNTDWIGFIRQCEDDKVELKNSNVKLLGAGGAAKAIVYALKKSGVRNLTIYNRTIEKAKEFGFEAKELQTFDSKDADLIINTISRGVSPINQVFDVPAIDISYGESEFLKFAHGRKYDGMKMLIFQAEESEKIWGIQPTRNMDKQRSLL